MDKGKQEFSDIQEWITHLLPDNSADFGIVKEEGVSLPSSSLSNPNPNQQNKPFPANTTNINPVMWQHSMRRNLENPNHSSARQNIGTSNNLQGFSHNQNSANAVSDLHQQQQQQQQQQLLQNRGQNIFQLPMQSNNNYPSYPRQQHKQVQVSPMVKHHHQETFNVLQHNNNQTTFLKSLERQNGFHLPQNFTMNDQLKLGNHSQNARLTPFQAVPESTPQMMSTNTVDWVDQACHKILQMKEHYLAEVTKIYHKSTEVIRHATTTEQLSKGQYVKESSQRMIKFLHCTRSDISRLPKEKVCNYISRCVKFINTARAWFPEATPHMQQRLNPETPVLNPSSTMVNSVQYSPMRSAPPQMWAPHGNNLSKMLHSSNNNNNSSNNNNNNLAIASQKIAMRNMCNSLDYSAGPTNKQQDLSSSAARMKTKQPMQQLRRFVGLNQKTVSPQNSQNSSKLSISATPSTCSSPLALPSPLSTPLMADSGKSPFSIEESSKFPEVSPSPVVEPPLPNNNNNNNNNNTKLDITTEALGLAKSKCVATESTCLTKENESPRDEEEPMKRLVDVLKSVSTGALTAALTEIKGVVALNDAIGGQLVLGQPMKVIFHDLGDDISNFVNGNSRLVDKTCTEYSKMKRRLDGVASNETGFFSSENRMIKRPRKELVMDVLMEEKNEIHQTLIEMVVDVKNAGDDEGGAHVRFSYTPVGFSRNIPNLLLDLIVSADYPNSSPTVSESMPIGCGDECMWKKAKSNFGLSIKKISEPVSIKEMARAWDFCAREVFHEFAKKTGGGNFSSKYGNWENCAVAAV